MLQNFKMKIYISDEKEPARASWGWVRPPCGSSLSRYCSGPEIKGVDCRCDILFLFKDGYQIYGTCMI